MAVLHALFNPALFGLLLLFLSILWMLRDPKDRARPLLVLALILNLFYGALLTLTMSREGAIFPWKYDHVLFCLDRSIGLQAVAVPRAMPGFANLPLRTVYELMVPAMIAWFLVTRRRWRGSVVLAYVAELIFGPLLYMLAPACGPIYAFGKQWLHPPNVLPGIIRMTGMPNAFPSLHLATAFVFLFSAPGKVWKAIAFLFLAATVLATLYTGEHYCIDLIPGLAFGCFAAYAGLRKGRLALGFLGVSLLWSLSVRFAYRFLIVHPGLLIAALALTFAAVVASLVGEWRNAARPQSVQESAAVAVPR